MIRQWFPLPGFSCQFVTVNLLYSHDTQKPSFDLLVISHSTPLYLVLTLGIYYLTRASTSTLFSLSDVAHCFGVFKPLVFCLKIPPLDFLPSCIDACRALLLFPVL